MRDLIPRLKALVVELRDRRVLRVAAVYIVAAVAVSEAADVMLPRLGVPDWAVTLVVALAALGLPVAVALAWAFDVTPEGVRPASSSRDPSTPRPDPSDRRPGTWVALALIAFVLLLAGTGLWVRWRTDSAGPVDSGTIAVLPFSFRGGDQYAYLGNGMVDLLSTKLDGAGSLRAVGSRAVLGIVRQTAAELDDEAAKVVARRVGAGLYVLGQVVEVSGRLHLSASVHRRGDAGVPVQASVEGAAENIFGLVDELAAQLLSDIAGGPGARVTRVAAATTHSLPALRAYLEGEEMLRGGHFPSALESFRRAIEEDSTFALAYYRLSIAAEWSGQYVAPEAAEQAYRLSGRLSAHDRRLVEALLAWRRGDALEAERLYRAIVGTYPDDVEAWFQLAEVLFHHSPWRGGSVAESREAFERVIAYEPDHVTSLWHLARIAAVEERTTALDSLVQRVVELAPEGDRVIELQSLQAFTSDDELGKAAVEEALHDALDLTRFMTVWNIAAYARDVRGAHRIAAVLTHPSRAPQTRGTGHLIRAHMELALGRPDAAARELEAVEGVDTAAALLHEALFALHPGPPPSPDALRAARRRLQEWDPSTHPHTTDGQLYFDPATPARAEARSFLLGVLSARLKDPEAAEDARRSLDALVRDGAYAGLASDYSRVVRAEMAMAAGDTAAAVEHLERMRGEVWYSGTIQSPIMSQPYARYRRAEALEAAGRIEEALTWFGSFDEVGPYDMAFAGVAALRRGRISEQLGDPAAAAAYRRALELWTDAEPAYDPLVAEARAGLGRTGG
jgi:tetratricopeptide (TPR) repeat protein